MINLIMKDILIQKKSFLFAVGYSLFIFIVFHNPPFENSIYIMGAVAITYILVLTAGTYDDKNKSEIVLNSLPITRKDIVSAKYLSALLFIMLGLGITGLTGFILNVTGSPLDVRYINLLDATITFVSAGLLVSIYFPIYFKFGSTYIRLVNVILFMMAFFLPNFIISYIRENPSSQIVQTIIELINTTPIWQLQFIPFLCILAVILISFTISINIYKNKEF